MTWMVMVIIRFQMEVLIEGIFERVSFTVLIEQMEFEDGLRFNCHVRKHDIITGNWKYLTRNNRLYPRELLDGPQPVAPNPLLTVTEDAKILPDDTIDAGEGFFNRETGFIVNRKQPLTFKRFVCDRREVKSILKQCRVSDDLELVLPDEEDCEKILRLNRLELAIINPEYECPCEADKKPTTRVKHEDEHSWSTISSSSICDEDVRVSDIAPNTRIAKNIPIFDSVDFYDQSLMRQRP
ncbi:uncharacterized protein LOC119671363 [Teleopsis dalmanni]|uniref:uncharacterized protein LOC119671363 n=1 Tax=Teleopsis dalmanni TaxID=139649 RepID=UPI0018CDFA0A|nr:uncharacterized protein LOC119671363 [Teleopsis dalmanni]